ncbi:uncharacterized protein [Ptychodera flava]|uniref:uncharacterized protein isoform X2 n=1 Tax=Ptychodera flava TaxID=63121 RepID=UPI003969BFD4
MSIVVSNMRLHFPRNRGNLVFLIGTIFTIFILGMSYRKIDTMVPEVDNEDLDDYENQMRRLREGESAILRRHHSQNSPPTYMVKYPWAMHKNYLPNFYTRRNVGADNRWPNDLSYTNSTIVFVDNHNSAGGVMKECLSAIATNLSLPKPSLVWNNNVGKFYKGIKAEGSDQSLDKLYLGGFSFGVCDYTNEPCSYYTVIREPYERIIASYVYCKGKRELPCQVRNAKGRPLSLKEWALRQGSFFFRQLLHNPEVCGLDYLSKIAELREPDDPSATTMPCWYKNKLVLDKIMTREDKHQVLDFILEHIETWFSVVGITDEYDTFLRVLQHAYKLPFESLCSETIENVVFKTDGEDYLSQSELLYELKRELLSDQDVFDALYFDVRIYQKMQEIFVTQKEIYFTYFDTHPTVMTEPTK